MSDKSKNIILSWIIGFCLIVIVGEAVAIIVLAIVGNRVDPYHMHLNRNHEKEEEIGKHMRGLFNPDNIGMRVEKISKQIHVAGTAENQIVTDYLHDQYKSFGLEVEKHSYEVMLSYPDWDHPNTVLLDNGTDWEVLSDGLGVRLGPAEALNEMNNTKTTHWWNAYSVAGNVTAKLVYANYCTLKDYDHLKHMGISVKDAIVLCRYGGAWRGAKVYQASLHGAVGVIIFSDPADYGGPVVGLNVSDVFPGTLMLPGSGAQRGTLMDWNGDPLTPFYPSKNYTYRSTNEEELREKRILPDIPCTPIGYRDALTIFESMDGTATNDSSWQGDMNVTYRYTSSKTYKLTANVASAPMTKITDVCATLYGKDDPDKIIMMGNHYDAWTNGAFDPNSGTTIMLEMADVLMQTVRSKDWKPRRSIRFCSWDAEEFGLVGSWEFMEQHLMNTQQNLVAYINMDIAVAGNISMPSLFQAVKSAASKVTNPNPNEVKANRNTVFDSWNHWVGDEDMESGQPHLPLMHFPGSGSDHYGFMSFAGVPIVDLAYDPCYTLYHSMYEVPWTVGHLMDQGWHTHVAMGRTVLETARSLADTLVIPLNLTDYAVSVQESWNMFTVNLQNDSLSQKLGDEFDQSVKFLDDAFARLTQATVELQIKIDYANSGEDVSVKDVEMLNHRITQFERAFINQRGLYAERPETRHVIFANSVANSYAGEAFPGVRDTISIFLDETTVEGMLKWGKLVLATMSELQYGVESAILSLRTDAYTS